MTAGHYYMGGWSTASNSGQRTVGDVLESERRLSEENRQLRAQVQAVRDVCAAWQDYDAIDRAMSTHLLTISKDDAAKSILRALDGDGDE